MFDLYRVINRTKNIIISPSKEWPVIQQDTENAVQVSIGFVFPFLLIVALADLGQMIASHKAASFIVGSLIFDFISPFIFFALSSWLITRISARYHVQGDFHFYYNLLAYSYTPVFIVAILVAISPVFTPVILLGFYSVWLYKKGIDVLIPASPKIRLRIFLINYLIIILINLLVEAILMYFMGVTGK